MRFRCPGQTLKTLGGIWRSCFERWHGEGMPAALDSIPDLLRHFGLQPHTWCGPQAQVFTWPPFERTVLGETPETVTYRNEMGIVCTDFKHDAYKSMPHFERFPVQSPADWHEYRQRLRWSADRVGEPWRRQAAELRTSQNPVILALTRGASLYGALRDMMGVEALSLAFYDHPDMVAEMMDNQVELFLGLADALFAEYVPDAVCLWEDMAYRNGSLLSVAHVRELMVPRYRRMTARLRDWGVPFILLDSDGRIDELIPLWMEAGIDGAVPVERQCGMNPAEIRRRWPRLLMMGGIDKSALARGPAAIDAEMAMVRETIASGGFVPFFDHGLPHNVSWPDFVHFAERLKAL